MNFSRKILAIAILTVRSAARTRVFRYMLSLTVIAVVGLPMIVKGDGTIEGYARVSLDYSLRLLTFILAAVSVWVAVGVSSREIEEKQIHLLVTKPVSPLQIWLGKWLGLLAMNAVLLLLAGICVSAMLRWNLRPSALTPEQRPVASSEILTTRRVIEPDYLDVDRKIPGRVDKLMAGNTQGPISRDDLLAEARREIIREENTVAPGASKKWTFQIGEIVRDSLPALCRYRMSSPRQLELQPVAVEWRVCRATNGVVISHAGKVFAGRPNSFWIPLSGSGVTLTAEFFNAQTNPPATVVFSRDRGVALLAPHGTFENNLARALIIIFCKLAVLSALGLTMGCVFSMPVAVFVACATIIAFNLSGMFTASHMSHAPGHSHSTGERSILDAMITIKSRVVDILFAPIRHYDPVEQLQCGELVPWSTVGEAFAVQVLLYSGIFAVLGVFSLKRRQLGMPAD